REAIVIRKRIEALGPHIGVVHLECTNRRRAAAESHATLENPERRAFELSAGKLQQELSILCSRFAPLLGAEEGGRVRQTLVEWNRRKLIAERFVEIIELHAGFAGLIACREMQIHCLVISGGLQFFPG